MVEVGRWARHPEWSFGGRAPATAHTYLTLITGRRGAARSSDDGIRYVTDLLLLDDGERCTAVRALQRACAEHRTPFASRTAPETPPTSPTPAGLRAEGAASRRHRRRT